MMTTDEIAAAFRKGFNCAQVVLMSFADELGYDEEELAGMASGFGGGMFRGDTCGCVSGALMALGLRYGHREANDTEAIDEIHRRVKAFQTAFAGRCGSLCCRELLSYDFAVEGEREKARASGVLLERCPAFARAAMEEVQKLLEE